MIEIKNLLNNDKKIDTQPRTSFIKRKLKILLTLQKGSFKGPEGNAY